MRKGKSKKFVVLVAPLFLNALACWAQAQPLAAPAQNTCENNAGKEIPCPKGLKIQGKPVEKQDDKTLEVKVVGKQESTTAFSYVVPGYTYSTYQSNPAWTGQGTTGYGVKTNGTATNIPAQEHSYSVRGAMLSLQLPDGRIAIVNCTGKTNWTDISHPNQMTRSCRIPPDSVTTLQAKFAGADAKLSWEWEEKKMISLNDAMTVTHKESETYKLIDVLVPAKAPAVTPPKENP